MLKKIIFLIFFCFLETVAISRSGYFLNPSQKLFITEFGNFKKSIYINGREFTQETLRALYSAVDKEKLLPSLPFISLGETNVNTILNPYYFPVQALQVIFDIEGQKFIWRLWFNEQGICRVLESVYDNIPLEEQKQTIIKKSHELIQNNHSKNLVAYLCLLISRDNLLEVK